MISRVPPPSVRRAHSFTDHAGVPLFPQEQAVIAHAVDRRRAEFTTVRALARTALADLGHPPIPLPDERGVPVRPDGVVRQDPGHHRPG